MRTAAVIAVALVVSAMLGSSVEAATAPPGSYQQSCRDITAGGGVLVATCRKGGQWNYTTLSDYRDCDGDIANVNGRLTCVRDPRQDDDDDDSDWSPRGSYQATCRRERVEDGTLIAECVDRNGRWRYTELQNYRSCRGDIANSDGMLRCRRDPDHDDGDDHGDDDADMPSGDWRATCRSERIYGSVLYAQCRDRHGYWRETTLDLRHCEDDEVQNRDGKLVCGTSGFGQITLYARPNYGGKSRTYATDIADLNPAAFGNEASSVVVQGGVWLLCDRPNYRGYCVIVDRSQANLWSLGFNDRAESLRRLR
jgi:hypothetical protein